MNKKAFSLIEVMISISIIIILAIVATTTSNNLKNNSNNSKVISDLNTIENALVAYKTENQNVPLPGGNNNYFNEIGNYVHSFSSTGSYGVYGKITQDTIPKKFIDVSPLDPRTNQYYSYGITKEDFQFEIAGVIGNDDNFIAKVIGNYTAENGPYSLIREYNGPNFVVDRGTNLPYNPENRELIVKDSNNNIYKSGDTINNNTGTDLTLYFSDGTTSLISNGTIIKFDNLDFPKENNLVSKVNLFLQAGSIWTKATRLGEESSFEINTSDITASVRGTVFKVEKEVSNTEVIVVEGIVDIYRKNTPALAAPIETIVLPGDMPKKTIVSPSTSPSPSSIINLPISTSENMIIVNEVNNLIETSSTSSDSTTKVDVNGGSITTNSEPLDCYLEDRLVKNGDRIFGYKEKSVEYGSTCSSPIERICSDGTLGGDKDYKFASQCYVEQLNQCAPLSIPPFTTSSPTLKNTTTSISKTENIELGSYTVGNKITVQEHKCIDGINYNLIAENITINCNSGFSDDGSGGCKCNTGTEFFEGSCYENPFGNEYELVEVVNTLPGGASTYKLADIGSGFGIVFTTKTISNNNAEFNYLQLTDGTKISYTKNNKIWLINSPNIIYGNATTNKTLELEFNGNQWKDKSGVISGALTGTNLNSHDVKLINNIENIRIYKKVSGPIPGEWYSGKGCDSCPNLSTDNGDGSCWGTKTCNGISGANNICKEKNFCNRDKKNWSGVYNP